MRRRTTILLSRCPSWLTLCGSLSILVTIASVPDPATSTTAAATTTASTAATTTSGHDAFDDGVHFELSWGAKPSVDELRMQYEPEPVTVREGGTIYDCYIPRAASDNFDTNDDGTGSTKDEAGVSSSSSSTSTATGTATTIRELLDMSLKRCLYRLEPYWSYEYCHMNRQRLRQYHEEKIVENGIKRTKTTEYILGIADKKKKKKRGSESDNNNEDQDSPLLQDATSSAASSVTATTTKPLPPPPPKFMFEGELMPYYSIRVSNGAKCDLTGAPRETEVRFICTPDAAHSLLSISETATCHYMAVVGVEALCRQKHFSVKSMSELNTLRCSPRAPASADTIPVGVQDFRAAQRDLELQENARRAHQAAARKTEKERRQRQAALNVLSAGGVTSGNTGGNTATGNSGGGGSSRGGGGGTRLSSGTASTSFSSSSSASSAASSSSSSTSTASSPAEKAARAKALRGMLRKNYCFIGGGNQWWNFEFCYNKHVKQFHREQQQGAGGGRAGGGGGSGSGSGKRTQEILLGVWDKASHVASYHDTETNPRPSRGRTDKPATTLYYAEGDYCEASDSNRRVSVVMSCSRTLKGSQVSLSLDETETCVYTLKVESPLFCDFLLEVDSDGLVTL